MEAASTFETSVNFYQTTRRYNSKNNDLQKVSSQSHFSFTFILEGKLKEGRNSGVRF
jgi:hypothetical protein